MPTMTTQDRSFLARLGARFDRAAQSGDKAEMARCMATADAMGHPIEGINGFPAWAIPSDDLLARARVDLGVPGGIQVYPVVPAPPMFRVRLESERRTEIDAFVERVIAAGEVDQLLGSIQRGLLREVPRRQDRIRLHIKTLRAHPLSLAMWITAIAGLVILLVGCGWPS